MAGITGVDSSTAVTQGTTGTSNNQNSIDKDEFLKILAAELKYQDPTDPMNNRDFVTQLAQFSTMEHMQNMAAGFTAISQALEQMIDNQDKFNNNFYILQASGLIGKTVSAQVDGADIEGQVTSIKIIDSIPYAIVNEKTIPISAVQTIESALKAEADASEPQLDNSDVVQNEPGEEQNG